MKFRLATSFVITAGILALIFTLHSSMAAQQNKDQNPESVYAQKKTLEPLPPGGPVPRLADGHPDLTGHWYVGFLGKEDATLVGSGSTEGNSLLKPFDPKVTPEEKPSFQPWAAAKMKETAIDNGVAGGRNFPNLPKEQKIALLNNEIRGLEAECTPRGVPAIFLGGGHGIEIVQSVGRLAQTTEMNHDYRLVYTDGRPHSKEVDPSFNGEGMAHWEGDTLVIDTVGIDERTGVTQGWTLHSDQEHVIERISRPSFNYLDYQVTIEDPKVLTKPWHSVVHHYTLSHEQTLEWYCGVGAHDNDDIAIFKEEVKKLQEEK